MSYVANQYNYATPLSSVVGLVGADSVVADKKYFTLADNVLDGSYYLIDGDVGIWGTSVSDANGVLPEPFTLTVEDTFTINAFRITGSQYSYPVAFTVQFYSGTTLLYTITESANKNIEYVHYLPRTISATRYVLTVTKISHPNAQVRLFNLYNPGYVKRQDSIKAKATGVSSASEQHYFASSDILYISGADAASLAEPVVVTLQTADTLSMRESGTSGVVGTVQAIDSLPLAVHESDRVGNTIGVASDRLLVTQRAASGIKNTIDVTSDRLRFKVLERPSHVTNTIDVTTDLLNVNNITKGTLINVHSRMKDPSRRIYGKVYITYTDPMLVTETQFNASEAAYNSSPEQVIDGNSATNSKFFTLYENDLSGDYIVSDERSQVGWVSAQLSNELGEFDDPAPYFGISFSERPIVDFRVIFDDSRGAVAQDFTIQFTKADGSTVVKSFTGNTAREVHVPEMLSGVVSVLVTVTKIAKAGYPVAILEIPVVSTILYVGYKERSDLISIDMLEELTYDDDVEALGGVSANEVTITLDNSNRDFYFNNPESLVARSLKRNRKIVPWLGVEVAAGEIEWYTLGTYWSYKWDVPVEGLVAKVIGFDTLGLLDTTSFTEHHVQINKSIGELIEYVLADAKSQLDFISYKIDEALYDIVVPYAWFASASHTAALRKISQCYPMHIYCDRDGNICAAPQKLRMDYYYDTWADSTNVISKDYSSLYTTLPNVINVTVKNPVVVPNDELASDELVFQVPQVSTRTLNFNKPYISDISVVVDCDSTVQYTYAAYSWGIALSFTGTGAVRSIVCTGTSLDVSRTSVMSQRDETSIRLNGAVTRDIQSDFIQDSGLASMLIERLLALSEYDKYDATVTYRGDIALSINDPILLLDGIAPDNRYNIKRHELFWNGALSGSAYLNT